MLVPTSQRHDRSVAVVTVRLDNENTDVKKKFHCVQCGNVVFAYYDTLHMLVPGEDNPENLVELDNAVNEIECTHRFKDSRGYYNRCRTVYVLNRG